jgi:hypothetical protein
MTNMNRRTAPLGQAAPAEARRAGPPAPADQRLNERIQAALQEGAETRKARDEAHSLADDRANQRESSALQGLIDGHRRSEAR